MKNLIILVSAFALSGCFSTAGNFMPQKNPEQWTAYDTELFQNAEIENLKSWWENFNDHVLNELIALGLQDSPDRLIAEARILEARGIKRTTQSALFPQIGVSGNIGRQDNAISPTDNYYDAGFDASFELDIFGKNLKNTKAADLQIQALEAQYHDTSLSLIAEIARSYIEFRSSQKQVYIASKNLEIQEKTLELIKNQKRYGEAPQLDVERAENLVNTTKASIPEFKRLAQNARLQLTTLTGALPSEIQTITIDAADIPSSNITPVLMAPADTLAMRPDILAATYTLSARTKLAEVSTLDLLPTVTLGGLFGVADSALISSATVWNVFAGAAFNLIDFGRIEGQIDSARAREKQAYEQYRRTVLNAIVETETALSDYAHINAQQISLDKAYKNADKGLTLSQTLYREGEISFLDVLDAQRTLNGAESALITAQANQAISLIRLYKSLGIY